ncbi:two-component system sensor histidine kinase YcbA [Anoxybacillus voinovskiensis]|uniref:histidine kinase n=1 Tax=Anoxybacteroides voinovskiense TaxID=230470 RepID=A0A840DSB8_9BACL|nr:sensor histidine kinase [Anoxybacillus voinovskiensis]MBB4072439.1 two-component system sensor histidine kinase YcbA [Anoxybacillus voinovskiensis]GGJ57824.1 sensor histidine kinase [Anoxybacillus voinovskiensis]
MRERMLPIFLLIIATAFFGEMKVNPFGSSFRFSLGSAVFFFGLIWFRTVPVVWTGLLTGLFISLFRTSIDLLMSGVSWGDSLLSHLPAACYYLAFALFVHALRLRNYMELPIHVALLGASIDFASNIVELFVRHLMGETIAMTHETVFMLILFGILRSFCVVGLYNILMIQQMQTLGEARRQELERLVMINATLYEEAFYLRKSMSHMEDITRKSYELYTKLMDGEVVEPSMALYIAEHVHEVKKDSQRIFAGLSELMNQEQRDLRLSIAELCGMVVRANQKYAELLKKEIAFQWTSDLHLSTRHVYALLSVLNNLVANAVEAIPLSGWIQLRAELDGEDLVFTVTDSGPGIPEDERDWVFQLGFTTKYDEHGNPSTGIGLTHAKEIVHSFNGKIQLTTDENGRTQFQINIPSKQL